MTNPYLNQAEQTAPQSSDYGQILHQKLRGGSPIYLHYGQGYQGDYGSSIARSSIVIPLHKQLAYTGILPMSQIPQVEKPYPYESFRG